MKVSDYTESEFFREAKLGIRFKLGPFTVRLRTSVSTFAALFYNFYAHYPLVDEGSEIADYFVVIEPPANFRRWWRPQVMFLTDDKGPFIPFPMDTTLPMFEWGLNWCIYTRANQYLMFHAAVLEKGGRVLLLPATPGSGKSTLCAALCHRGWRLFSDEFVLVCPDDGTILPIPRPISLKNESIDVIRQFAPDAYIGPSFPKTRKGTVAHVRAPATCVERMGDVVSKSSWVIYPRYQADVKLKLEPLAKPQASLRLAGNSFNYEVLGAAGFRATNSIIRQSDCYTLEYSRLDDAISVLDDLARKT